MSIGNHFKIDSSYIFLLINSHQKKVFNFGWSSIVVLSNLLTIYVWKTLFVKQKCKLKIVIIILLQPA